MENYQHVSVARRLNKQNFFILVFQQLNHLDYGQQNGLPERDLYMSNHNSSEVVSCFVF